MKCSIGKIPHISSSLRNAGSCGVYVSVRRRHGKPLSVTGVTCRTTFKATAPISSELSSSSLLASTNSTGKRPTDWNVPKTQIIRSVLHSDGPYILWQISLPNSRSPGIVSLMLTIGRSAGRSRNLSASLPLRTPTISPTVAPGHDAADSI